jgi:hypothetical protein
MLASRAGAPAARAQCEPGLCTGGVNAGICGFPELVETGTGCVLEHCQTPQVTGPSFTIAPVVAGGRPRLRVRMVMSIVAPWNNVPTGTIIGGATMKEHSCGEGGWCIPWEPREPFAPYINPSLEDPCVVYCIRVHEWYHFQDRRPWNLNWESKRLNGFWEKPAYQLERHCLLSFM